MEMEPLTARPGAKADLVEGDNLTGLNRNFARPVGDVGARAVR